MERDDDKRQQFSGDGPVDRLRPWRRISAQLVSLIGESGFCALFGRAVRTLAVRYDWLSIDPSRRSIDALLAALERDLAAAGPAAGIANEELLDTFTRQLSTLIGGALTARLLAQARAADPGRPEDAQEHK